MTAPSLDRPEWKVHCKATRKNGELCKKWAIRGGAVCEMHGGSTPQVKQAAERRIEEARASVINLLPEATVRLRELLRSPNANVAIRAVAQVFDRAGVTAQSEQHIRVETLPNGLSIDDEIEQLLANGGGPSLHVDGESLVLDGQPADTSENSSQDVDWF